MIVINFNQLLYKNFQSMFNQDIHFCYTLSVRQVQYLRSKKYKIDRMDCFMSLMGLAERESKIVPISKTKQVKILPGQIMTDFTHLAQLWGLDRKTVPKIMKAMEELDISSSQKIGDNHIFTLHALTGWYVNCNFVPNPYGIKRNATNTAIFHAAVPPARIIVIEPDDNQNMDAAGKDIDKGSSPAINVDASSFSSVPASHQPSQSIDNGNVGKSNSGGNCSSSLDKNLLPQSEGERNSADNPSSQKETNSKTNEGKQNETPSQQSPRQPYNGNQGCCQKPCGYNNPNDSQNGHR